MSILDLEIPPTAGLPLELKDFLSAGPGDFAQQLAGFLSVPEVGLACSGTTSLIIILQTLARLSCRKTVVIPAYTCPLMVFAVARSGLKLRICDVRPRSFELDHNVLASVCDADTLAIIPTHLGGRVADLGPVLSVARQCGAYIIEDAAQALGARNGEVSVGLQGDAGFFSLAAGKGLSLFEGGAWVCGDEALRGEIKKTAKQLIPRDFGWEARRCLELLGYALFYRPQGLPYVYGRALRDALSQRDQIAAAGDYFSPDIPMHQVSKWRQRVGRNALSRLPAFQRNLARIAAARLPRLQAIPGLVILTDPPGASGTWPLFMALLPEREICERILAELWGAGIGVGRMFAHALSDYPYLQPWLGNDVASNAREFAACSLTITNSPWLNDTHFERILEALSRHCR